MSNDVDDKYQAGMICSTSETSSTKTTIATIPPELMNVNSPMGIPTFLRDSETILLMCTSKDMWVTMLPSIGTLLRRKEMKLQLKMATRLKQVFEDSCKHELWTMLGGLGEGEVDDQTYQTDVNLINVKDGMYVFYEIQSRFDTLLGSVPGVVRVRRAMHFVDGRFEKPSVKGERPGGVKRGRELGFVGRWRLYDDEVVGNIRGLIHAGYEIIS
jgi:hypothetical protein